MRSPSTLTRSSLVGLVAAGMVVLLALGGAPATSASGGGPAQSLDVVEGGFCDGGVCYAEAGSSFLLQVTIDEAPANGYVVAQTFLDFSNFDPNASEDGAGPGTCSDDLDNNGTSTSDGRDERDTDCLTIVLGHTFAPDIEDNIIWPDANPAIAFISELVNDGGGLALIPIAAATGFIPPLPISSYTGPFAQLEMSCPATPVESEIAMRAPGHPAVRSPGTEFVESDHTHVATKLDALTLHCVDLQAHPGDTDGDGCSDAQEMGANPALGGDRDWLNPWDFYDVNGDKVIDLSNDILGVINHYGPAPGPPYDVQYDRGPWTGANSWEGTTAPDGVIDLSNDINGVSAQHGHSCT